MVIDSTLLRTVLLKYRRDFSEELVALLVSRMNDVARRGKEIADSLEQMKPDERVIYLGSLVLGERIKAHQDCLASYPKAVSPVHELRSGRP